MFVSNLPLNICVEGIISRSPEYWDVWERVGYLTRNNDEVDSLFTISFGDGLKLTSQGRIFFVKMVERSAFVMMYPFQDM